MLPLAHESEGFLGVEFEELQKLERREAVPNRCQSKRGHGRSRGRVLGSGLLRCGVRR